VPLQLSFEAEKPRETLAIRRICATCVHRKTCVQVSKLLLELCYRFVLDKHDEAAIIGIIEEAVLLSKAKHKCSREPHAWTHLFDMACAFWLPRESTP